MVMMPMREQNRLNTSFLFCKHLTQAVDPEGLALTGVDEDAPAACAEEIGVCALECEFAGVVGEDADYGGAEARDGREVWKEGGHDGGVYGVDGEV